MVGHDELVDTACRNDAVVLRDVLEHIPRVGVCTEGYGRSLLNERRVAIVEGACLSGAALQEQTVAEPCHGRLGGRTGIVAEVGRQHHVVGGHGERQLSVGGDGVLALCPTDEHKPCVDVCPERECGSFPAGGDGAHIEAAAIGRGRQQGQGEVHTGLVGVRRVILPPGGATHDEGQCDEYILEASHSQKKL